MKNDKLSNMSMDFAVSIYKLSVELKKRKENIISDQILKSATSIGANISEARYAASRADFINKFHIALKETNETAYWLELLLKTENISVNEYKYLEPMCREIRILLVKSIKTAKNNQ